MKGVDKHKINAIINKKILSRVDERIGFKTPQQPVKKQGANTDKVISSTLDDDLTSNK